MQFLLIVAYIATILCYYKYCYYLSHIDYKLQIVLKCKIGYNIIDKQIAIL
jgi:hypothetical protein